MNDTLSKLGLQCLEDFRAKLHVLSNMEGLAYVEAGYADLPEGRPMELQAEETDAAISTFEKLILQLTAGFIPQDLVQDVSEPVSDPEQEGARKVIDGRQMSPVLDRRNRIGQSVEGMSNRKSKYVETTASERVSIFQPNREVNSDWDTSEDTTANWQAPPFSPKEKESTQLPGMPKRIPESGQEFKSLGGLGEMGGLFDTGRSEPVYEDGQSGDQKVALLENLSFASTPEQEVQREVVATGFPKPSLKSPEINAPAQKSRKYHEWQAHTEMDAGQSTGPNIPEKGSLSINLNVIMEELKEKLQNEYERHYGDQTWL